MVITPLEPLKDPSGEPFMNPFCIHGPLGFGSYQVVVQAWAPLGGSTGGHLGEQGLGFMV